ETGGLRPVLSFDVGNNRRFRPCEQRRYHETDTFTRARWSECQDMLRSVMPQVGNGAVVWIGPTSDLDAFTCIEETRARDIFLSRPPCGTVHILGVSRQLLNAPQIEEEKETDRGDTTACDG